jgi:pimeloyl-ACP methyl ester carboxylesterase
MTAAPIVLVPGFWLGAWAWDDVVALLRADGHDVTAITLPGLESVDADRSTITMADHVDAICEEVRAAGAPALLAVHSGAGAPGYGASDRIPELIAAMVYVDSGPALGAINPDFAEVEWPLPSWEELESDPGNSIEGISAEQLATWRERAVPEPGAALREAPELSNDARLDVPSVVVCTALSSDQIKEAIAEGYNWVMGLDELHDVTYVDLPTSHWSMWTRPTELASIIGDVANRSARP